MTALRSPGGLMWLALAGGLLAGCRSDQAASGASAWPALPVAAPASRPGGEDGGAAPVADDEPGLPFGEDEQRTTTQVALAHPSTYRAPQGPNITRFEQRAVLLEPDVATAVERAAAELPAGLGLLLVEGFRTPEQQLALMQASCENRPGYKRCDSKTAQPPTCMLRLDDRHSCPHTTGRAVDLLGQRRADGGWQQCVSQRQCLTGEFTLEASAEVCAAEPCQAEIIAAMRRAGFCVHRLQPWHFEQPALSAACQ